MVETININEFVFVMFKERMREKSSIVYSSVPDSNLLPIRKLLSFSGSAQK